MSECYISWINKTWNACLVSMLVDLDMVVVVVGERESCLGRGGFELLLWVEQRR